MSALLVLLTTLLVAGAIPARASEPSDLVDRVVEAYGGTAALERLGTFRAEGEIQATIQGTAGTFRRDYQRPDRLRVEIRYPTASEVRILDGEKGWRGDERVLRRVDGLPKVAMMYQLVRSALPECLVWRRSALQDLGSKAREDAEYRVLRLPWSNELAVTFWIHPKTYRVVWVEGSLQLGQSRGSFATKYGNFHEVDGVVFPFLEENFVGEQRTGVTKVHAVIFGPPDPGPFEPSGLAPPGGDNR
ncbi:MAG: hypothetical protein HY900_27640 [Deltaproteobacteria bacterium]|nr:hypothetical protein [Deltaproteobacteria bacterium]